MAIGSYMTASQQPHSAQQNQQNQWQQQQAKFNQQMQQQNGSGGTAGAMVPGSRPPQAQGGQAIGTNTPTNSGGGQTMSTSMGMGSGGMQAQRLPPSSPQYNPPQVGTGPTVPKASPSPYAPSTMPSSSSGWNPQLGAPPSFGPPGNLAGVGGKEGDFFGGLGDAFGDPNAFNANDNPYAKYIAAALPVAQFGQNNYQWRNEFNEMQRISDRDFGRDIYNDQFQQQFSTRQQQMAEWQAQEATKQWAAQFGHTRDMDWAGLGLSQQEINNALTIGMGQNEANRYASELGLQGQLGSANIYAGSQNYQADQQLAGTLGSANIYAGAQNYGADQQRIASMYGADKNLAGTLGSAGIYASSQNYGAELGLQGTLGSAGMYSDAQRYGAELGLQGTMGSAGLYSGAQKYTADQDLAAAKYQWDMQMAMNQAMMANNLQVANIGAYGRSQAPAAQWARSWS